MGKGVVAVAKGWRPQRAVTLASPTLYKKGDGYNEEGWLAMAGHVPSLLIYPSILYRDILSDH